MELKGSGVKLLGLADEPNSDTDFGGVVSNWLIAADPSNSGPEAMGRHRIQPAAGTIAAFVAMQDV